MRVEINPPEMDSEYLRCLNACFPGWGDTQMAQWAFRRGLAPDPMPDLMVLREENELLAGSAVSYRSVVLPNGNTVRAGIMTGSWTLPAARGRGCFTRIIEESVAITRQRGGALLLAFVTEDNPSCRQLLKAGAAAVPTSYLFTDLDVSRNEKEAASGLVTFKDAELAEVIALWEKGREGKSRFAYSSFEDWKGQFIDRPATIETARNASGAFAVIDRNATTDRILAWWAPSQAAALQFLSELHADALSKGRKLFTFSTDAAIAGQCEAMGFKRKPGYLTVMVTDWERLGQALETTALPESENHVLLDPASPWFVGEWDIQSGDRM